MAVWNPRANEIFLKALEARSPEDRGAYLDEACAGDISLRAQAEALLAANDQAGSFLESPEVAVATVDEPIREGPGTVIGSYKLLEQIGEGGFGLVFMAEQQEPIRRKVAVKVLKPGMDTRQVIARFEAERQALALMDHPNIAKVHEAGETASGRPYFVMELVKGIPTTDYCDQNQVPIRERLELFVPVCQAVQHAHQKGIIHRDIKPTNVLVTLHDGTLVPKIIDFGIAKALGPQLTEKTLYTGFAQLIGTPMYMSPEQAALSGLDVDTRSDIYSLGVMLYELLTGSTPFDKERFQEAGYDEIRRIIREEEPPKPSTRISTLGKSSPHAPRAEPATRSVPTTLASSLETIATQRKSDPKRLSQLFRGELDWIVMKALEKDRNRRYETASAFAADVQHYLNDEPVQACPPSAWYRFRKFARRRKSALAVAGLILFFFASLGGGAGWVMRDRLVREAALDQTVEGTLSETGPLIDQGKWPEALALVDRADQLLAAAGRTERPKRLRDLRRDLVMAERLEQIYHEPKRAPKAMASFAGGAGTDRAFQAKHDSSEEEFFWGREQDARFAREFREFGIDLEALAPAEAAARISRTSVPQALVRALDEWAAMRKRARGDDDPFWKKLVEVARQSDPDDWRNRFRDALLRRDRVALETLADAVPIREVPPATVYLLGHALRDLGAVDKAMTVLRQAHRQHPDDFWLNDVLGYFSKDALQPPRYDDALRYYSMTLALRPGNVHTHQAVAGLLERKGAMDEAIAEYSRAIEVDPKNAQAWNNRGSAYSGLQQYDKALGDYSKAIEVDPKYAAAWNNRGYTYDGLHQYDKALADYSKAIEVDPKLAVAWNNRGSAYYGLHQYDKAFADLNKAIELDPKMVAAWVNRGSASYGLHQYEKALADYSKAIELDPKMAMAWSHRGNAYNRLQQFDKALADLNKAIEVDPKYAWAWGIRGDAYKMLHQYEKAIADYTRAVELDPSCAACGSGLMNSRGVAYMELHQYEKALADFIKLSELDPKNAGAWLNRGWAYSLMHQYDQARAEYSKAVELDPKFATAWNNLAWLLATCADSKFRDTAKAVRFAKKAVELAPTEGTYWNTLGAAHYRAGEWKAAVQALKKSMDLRKGGDSFDWFLLAMAHWQLGEKDKARQWYERALEWMDKNQPKHEELGRFQAEAAELLRIEKKAAPK